VTARDDLLAQVPALLRRARALLRLPGGPPDRLAAGELRAAARAVAALHEGLVGGRPLARTETYGERAHLGAYLLWWWPQSYAKVRAALNLIPAALPAGARVLDLGAGPGPASLAALDHLREASARGPAPEALAADASEAALAEARALSGPHALQTRLHRLQAAPAPVLEGRFDLAIAANVLSELEGGPAARAELLAGIAERNLAPRGILLLLEPALRETGRGLLQIRDALLAQHGLRALAPCLTQRPCPALEAARDWCTAARPWEAPPHVVQLARELGLRADEELSFSYLAAARAEGPLPAAPAGLWRVVGLPPREKGKKRIFVCADAGRLPASRLERDESPSNAAFGSVGRGDLVRLGGVSNKGDGLRVGPSAEVQQVEDHERAAALEGCGRE
jgi:hypothetical protein